MELCCSSAHCSNHAVPNYKNSHPLVITLRLSLYPDQTLGDRIKKWRLEQGLFQVDLAKRVGVSEMTVVNWEKGKTKPIKQIFERLEKIWGDLPSSNNPKSRVPRALPVGEWELAKGRQA